MVQAESSKDGVLLALKDGAELMGETTNQLDADDVNNLLPPRLAMANPRTCVTGGCCSWQRMKWPKPKAICQGARRGIGQRGRAVFGANCGTKIGVQGCIGIGVMEEGGDSVREQKLASGR